ncbi:TssN family type VI secretion system protein [Prevotella sp. 10(H)]|uniref:TssN family type VI secretion system protein n=1 Tax=Prevotella sp. 10(H) TaxID=1158294 RepID=UPI0004A73AF1|nr:TssN family type VI secretion system protein [Prevotella sp. 10(H)]
MEFAIGKFVLLYLLMPIIGLILGVVMVVVAKKNKLLANKKIIFYFLSAVVIMVVPAFLGFIDYWFMPYVYIGLMGLYLILGYVHLGILEKIIDDYDEKPYYVEFLFSFVLMIVSAAFFSLAFNLCNELQYGLWASTCIITFIFPTLFIKSYESFMEIPLEVYRIWSYDKEEKEITIDDFDKDNIIVVELEMFKQVEDTEPLNIKAKSSEITPFGPWFKTFISDYNKKSPQSPIRYKDNNDSYGWIFYVTSFLGRKRYIDPDLSFSKNKIKEKKIIIAKRVQYEDYTD